MQFKTPEMPKEGTDLSPIAAKENAKMAKRLAADHLETADLMKIAKSNLPGDNVEQRNERDRAGNQFAFEKFDILTHVHESLAMLLQGVEKRFVG